MPKFAVLDSNNEVVNFIVADNTEIANKATGGNCIDVTDMRAQFGDIYDGTQFVKKVIEESNA